MAKTIKVGTRPSALALKQVEEVRKRLPQYHIETVLIETRGDKDKISSLSDKENSDFFTREIEQALIDGSIDAAIHSAKDLEDVMSRELVIAAMTSPISPFECLVSRGGSTMEKLPLGACVGTSSRKRRRALMNFRPDLDVKDIRGDIDERLAQLNSGKFDAIIVAHAALIRLGYEDRIAEIIPREIMEPHPLQGSLAVQIRRDRDDLSAIFRSLDGK
ncbi:MAG: hydroxymethylbilane synthase [Candidatus Omnitrophica bacterium]|nr:hydroxymethylbilane synthase [Candidatus Omnitrophota bacterium]MBU1037933.1 hydroxymethylbilane synthase [Candidatus Omnitrophota bacterium]MBU1808508.1 hydroxymethylbilane synthase [Candidatus Omnitrophota bacterium]